MKETNSTLKKEAQKELCMCGQKNGHSAHNKESDGVHCGFPISLFFFLSIRCVFSATV